MCVFFRREELSSLGIFHVTEIQESKPHPVPHLVRVGKVSDAACLPACRSWVIPVSAIICMGTVGSALHVTHVLWHKR